MLYRQVADVHFGILYSLSMRINRDNIKLILFDLGGVLVELGDVSDMWADKKGDYAEEDFWTLWLNDDSIQAIDCGKMEIGEFLNLWIENWNLEISVEDLKKIYREFVRNPYPGALELIEDCRKNYTVACLSNMTAGHWPIVQDFGFADCFDHMFISCLTNSCKPNRRAYEIVLEQCPFEPHEILFIDDNVTNLKSAEELGINILEARTAVGAREALVQFSII
ncbi:MAG: hypothetical protein COB20_09505 [SAR86 cluster bacterium]|uniref:HAD family phosphatase n=1 Tax=SAR86 cluster bacterium TaxID=2030880 RepID=A0A2A4X466_9GAMM|nr:MAG: hypothetical protein COB20_09505 [SAR86 cluster bacterium]